MYLQSSHRDPWLYWEMADYHTILIFLTILLLAPRLTTNIVFCQFIVMRMMLVMVMWMMVVMMMMIIIIMIAVAIFITICATAVIGIMEGSTVSV